MTEIKKIVFCSKCKKHVPRDEAVDLGDAYYCKKCFEEGVKRVNEWRKEKE